MLSTSLSIVNNPPNCVPRDAGRQEQLPALPSSAPSCRCCSWLPYQLPQFCSGQWWGASFWISNVPAERYSQEGNCCTEHAGEGGEQVLTCLFYAPQILERSPGGAARSGSETTPTSGQKLVEKLSWINVCLPQTICWNPNPKWAGISRLRLCR